MTPDSSNCSYEGPYNAITGIFNCANIPVNSNQSIPKYNSWSAPNNEYPCSGSNKTGSMSFCNIQTSSSGSYSQPFAYVINSSSAWGMLYAIGSSQYPTYQSNDFQVLMSDVMKSLHGGETIFIKPGYYGSANSPILINKPITIIGSDITNDWQQVPNGTKLVLYKSLIINSSNVNISNILIDGSTNNFQTNSDVVKITSSNVFFNNVEIKGNYNNNGLHFAGASNNYLGNNVLNNVKIVSTKNGMILNYSSQNYFENMYIGTWNTSGISFNWSDNNLFGFLEMVSSETASGPGIILGSSSTDQSYSEHFNYLSITEPNTPIIINTKQNNWNGQTIIDHYGGNDPRQITYTNGGYGNILITPDTTPYYQWNVSTPNLPTGLGIINKVINILPLKAVVYLAGSPSGIHIIDQSGVDRLLKGNPTTIILDPGNSIYFVTNNPTGWDWDGI